MTQTAIIEAFPEHAEPLLKNGYSPVPIIPGTKRPYGLIWTRWCNKPLTMGEVSANGGKWGDHGTGVACGFNRLLHIDIDTEDEKARAAIIAVLKGIFGRGGKAVAKAGKRGYGVFFRLKEGDDTASHNLMGKDKRPLVEFLSWDRQAVIPPTIHPETLQPYQWLTRDTLFNTPIHQLPEISLKDLEEIEKALKPWLREYQADDPEIEKLGVRPHDQELTQAEAKRYSAFAREGLKRRAAELAETLRGARNDTLFRAVCCFGKYAHWGLIPWEEIYSTFHQACQVNRLIRDKGLPAFNRSFNSGRARSANDPLPNLPERPLPGSVKAGGQPNGERKPEAWDDPAPLPEPLAPVKPFSFDLLPEPLRPLSEDIAEKMQCPPDFLGVATMTGLGAVIGRQVGIMPKTHDEEWFEVPNQWAMLIGRPSVMKSPAMEAALKPISLLEGKAQKQFNDELKKFCMGEHLSKLEAQLSSEAAKKELKSGNKQAAMDALKRAEVCEPFEKRYTTDDSTVAALTEILKKNHNGILIKRDELISLVEQFGRPENAGDRGFYLGGWAGKSSYNVDRIERGRIHIKGLCLSLIGTTQPGKISRHIRTLAEAKLRRLKPRKKTPDRPQEGQGRTQTARSTKEQQDRDSPLWKEMNYGNYK